MKPTMAGKSMLLALLMVLGADALRTKFSVTELQQMAANSAALEDQYREVLMNAQRPDGVTPADVDPSLLYPAYNLSVPVDHFFNDSIYEPHVRTSLFCLLVCIQLMALHRPMTPST